MNTKTIRILVARQFVGQVEKDGAIEDTVVLTLENVNPTLKNLQELVGGHIERVPLRDGVDLYCNEDGIQLDLSHLANIYGNKIFGNFFLTRSDEEGEMASLTYDDIDKYGRCMETTFAWIR